MIVVTSLVAYVIPDMPAKLRKQMRQENRLTNEIILKFELVRADRGRLQADEIERIRRQAVEKLLEEDTGAFSASLLMARGPTAAGRGGDAADAGGGFEAGFEHGAAVDDPERVALMRRVEGSRQAETVKL